MTPHAATAGITAPAMPSHDTLRQFLRVAGGFWASGAAWRARGATAALVALTVAQVLLAIRLNTWNADLFDALERKSTDQFLLQVAVFALLLTAAMAINAAHLHIKRRLQLDWRAWLTQRMIDGWMRGGRHYQIGLIRGELSNPDSRIAEDVRVATESAIDLAHSLFYCLLAMVSFLGILWSLSGTLRIALDGIEMSIPGHMVWLALVYAVVGNLLAYIVGRPLVRAADRRQTAEADFRFGLVHAREAAEVIALSRGEAVERHSFARLFAGIERWWAIQTAGLRTLVLFSSGYGMLATTFPILVTTPRYLLGTITLGGLMQSAQAFQQVAAALSWPVDNFPKLAEWHASVERVLALQAAVDEAKKPHDGDIVIERVPGESLRLQGLSVNRPDGRPLFAHLEAEIRPGERVLVCWGRETGGALLKVVAGLWPWGEGRIELPDGDELTFMARRPYLPVDTLRRALTYPLEPDRFDRDWLLQALRRVGLEQLATRLDETDRWHEVLSAGEQQRLGFAHLLIHRPKWALLESPTDDLDPNAEQEMMRLFGQELAETTLLTVADRPGLERHHGRKLNLDLSDPDVAPCGGGRAVTAGASPRRGWLERMRQGLGHGAR